MSRGVGGGLGERGHVDENGRFRGALKNKEQTKLVRSIGVNYIKVFSK